MSRYPFKTNGLTMIELMITLAIAGILIASAAPSFRTSIQNNRMVTQINELQTSLNLARSEAIKRNDNVTVCQSSNGTGCTGGNWEDGWIIFVDEDFQGDVDAGVDEILRVDGVISGDNTLTFSQTEVIYARDGFARPGSAGTFTLCDTRGTAFAKGLVVGVSGRPRLSIDSNSNGTLEDFDGNELVCL